ncbi:MAG: OmpA family protein [Polyangiaceae bacterium]|nr:OmpA family protein [Polyangiaceae bacterium]
MRARTLSRWLLGALAGFAAAAGSSEAIAQEQDALALNRFHPAPAGDRMFGVQSPFVAGEMTPHMMLLLDYAHNPLVLRREADSSDIGSVVGNQLFLHANATFALWNRIAVNLDLPIALAQSGDSPTPTGTAEIFTSPDSAQLGDLRIGLRLRLLGDYFDPFQLAIGGYLWVPTGNSDPGSYVSDGSIRGLPQLIAGGRGDKFVWSAAVGPEIRGSQTYATVEQGTSIQGGAGFGVLLGEQRHLQVGIEASIGTVLGDPSRRNTNAELLLGGRYRIAGPIEIGLGVGPGLTSGIGTPDFRGVAMIAYSPEQKKPEPPPPDRDKDTIIDAKDACPDTPGLANADPKKHGCPPPPDTDKDTIIDELDACPTEPGPANDDPKKHGCPPPPDKDKDGIIDAQDACVDVPGVADAEPKKNGCPPDKDNDGVYDAQDACVDIPGLKTADPATNGCPGDTDGDTIRDDKDACPNEKGKADADPQKNGCPVAVRVTDTEIIILQQVQFDTARSTIRKVSDPLLDEVAAVLQEHPEILKVEVQGHTDNRGGVKYNERLSQDRSNAVMKALVKRGVDAGRMTAKGYGPHQPIADNDSEEGRQKNRRVQFKITEKKPKAPAQ